MFVLCLLHSSPRHGLSLAGSACTGTAELALTPISRGGRMEYALLLALMQDEPSISHG